MAGKRRSIAGEEARKLALAPKKRRHRSGATHNLIVVSDVHCGCRLGLCPREGVQLDDGGRYMPSAFQLKVLNWWEEFWGEWVPHVTRGEPYDVVFNGDGIDGVHHNSTTQVSHNLNDQIDTARALLWPIAEGARASGGKYRHIRGTEAHVGKSAQEEERLAKMLDAVPNQEGQHARYELWKYIGPNEAVLAHLLHHIGTTGSMAYESTAVHKELAEAYAEAGRWNRRPPDVVVRSHRHRAFRTEVPTHNTRGVACVTPGWQGKTPFVWKIPGGRQSEPQFGGLIIRYGEEGEWYVRHWVRSLERSKPEA